MAACGEGESSLTPVLGVFFFQAEDGIRDLTVTGVQTCALPISRNCLGARQAAASKAHGSTITPQIICEGQGRGQRHKKSVGSEIFGNKDPGSRSKIGRASCRERV